MVTDDDPIGPAVAAVWRIESARIVGALTRYTGDLALAEDVAQEALAEALVSWRRDGMPSSPAGWLMATARRRAIDTFRRRTTQDDRYAVLARDSRTAPTDDDRDLLFDPDRIDDDRLALIFIACHPALSKQARIALTLRVVGGLSSEEIAHAFLVPVPTIQARITRAKKTLRAARVPFAPPSGEQRSDRVGSVLNVIYLIFTEGSTASTGPELIRGDLAEEAVRLARVLVGLIGDEPEAYGLLALLELTAARFPARTDAAGAPVLLADQDRRRWDAAAIRRGRAALAQAITGGQGLGPYGLQAAVAEQHDIAGSVGETDWERIVLLYEALVRIAPSPVVELNRAVAVSMAYGPERALPLVDDLVASEQLTGSHAVPGVRGELLARLGRNSEARAEFERAARLCGNERERRLLLDKAAANPPTATR